MLRAMNRRRRICACVSLVLFAGLADAARPARSHAQERERDETERWVPSIAFSSGVYAREAQGEVRSSGFTDRLGDPDQLRPPDEGHDLVMGAWVNGSVELMTPGLAALPGRPRLFVHGGGGGIFGIERDLAKEGSPEEFASGVATLPSQNQPEIGISGQGSTTTVEVQPFDIAAGAGIAFSMDVLGRRVRLKPSVEYFRETVEVSGLVQRAIRTTVPSNVAPTEFLLVSLSAEEEKVHQGLGGGLELEVDAARAGPFLLSLFAGGQVYRVLGDRDLTLTDALQIQDDPVLQDQTIDATWEYESNPWIYRGGVGLRFRWLPE